MHSIFIEAEMEIICLAYETKSINLIDDLYSISLDVCFNQKELTTMSGKQNIKEICDINQKLNVPEITGNKLCNVKTIPNITNTSIRNGKIIYEGEVNIEMLLEINNSINSKNINIPFNFEVMSNNIEKNCNIDTNVNVRRDDYVINGETIDVSIELEFNIKSSKNQKLNIINEISLEENRTNDMYSMVIYFVRPKDTLWKIAKKFRSTVNDIAVVNGIEDENSIRVGQQLYIPKFTNKDIAV